MTRLEKFRRDCEAFMSLTPEQKQAYWTARHRAMTDEEVETLVRRIFEDDEPCDS